MDYLFKTTPFEHQSEAFFLSRDRRVFALLMEMGTGKSKVIVDTAGWLYGQGKIQCLIVMAPNGVHRNWIDQEIPAHLPDEIPRTVAYWKSSPRKAEKLAIEKLLDHKAKGLRIFTVNVEAFSQKQGKAFKFTKKLLQIFNCLVVVDESTRIKSPSANRTRAVTTLGNLSEYKRILTGMPIPQGPIDFYAQFRFLDPRILGWSTFTAFRAHYAELCDDNDPLVVAIKRKSNRPLTNYPIKEDANGRPIYRNLSELRSKVAKHSFRCRKAECLDLPDKLYERVYFEITSEQRGLYKELAEKAVVELRGTDRVPPDLDTEAELLKYLFDGDKVKAELSITKYLRWQQVIGGFVGLDPTSNSQPINEFSEFVEDHGATGGLRVGNKTYKSATGAPIYIFDKNPKLDQLVELIKDTTGKLLIWARFRPEHAMIAERLKQEFGDWSVVEYHGGVDQDDRAAAVLNFQDMGYNKPRFFVGEPGSGGIGLTLTAATTVVYYSNSFDLEKRLQSEDRAHRIGQKNAVLYVDLIARNTVDDKIVDRLAQKADLAYEILDGEKA